MLNLKIQIFQSRINLLALFDWHWVTIWVDFLHVSFPHTSVSLVVFDHSFQLCLGHIFLNIVEKSLLFFWWGIWRMLLLNILTSCIFGLKNIFATSYLLFGEAIQRQLNFSWTLLLIEQFLSFNVRLSTALEVSILAFLKVFWCRCFLFLLSLAKNIFDVERGRIRIILTWKRIESGCWRHYNLSTWRRSPRINGGKRLRIWMSNAWSWVECDISDSICGYNWWS